MSLFTYGDDLASAAVLDRFTSKIRVTNGCWEWLGTRDSDGYGVIKITGRMYKAHRVAYYYEHGNLPGGQFICHMCDNRKCVNPSHLFAGYPSANSHDMVVKGRSARGERDAAARLTAGSVKEILTSLASGQSKKSLARQYGVSDTAIRYIATGKTWSHVQVGGI